AAVVDRTRLAHELVHPLVVGRADAVLVDVEASGGSWCLPVDVDAEAHRWVADRRTHHEVDVAGVELERDGAARLGQDDGRWADPPGPRQPPCITGQRSGGGGA